jgi:hypothetical protein
MKTLLLSLLLYITAFTAIAQSVKDVVGNWEFYTVKADENTSAEKMEKAAGLMSSMTLNLNEDKTYTMAFMGLNETGKWEVKDKKIEFTTDAGKSYSFDILAVEKNLLTLDQKKFAIVLSRAGAKVPPPHFEPKPKKTYVTAYTPQLTKKWHLKSCPAPQNLTTAEKEAFGEMLAGSYLELKTNGKCTLQFGDKKQNGQWQLNADKNGITTTLTNIPATLYFIKVTSTDLVITEADSYDDWYFSIVE